MFGFKFIKQHLWDDFLTDERGTKRAIFGGRYFMLDLEKSKTAFNSVRTSYLTRFFEAHILNLAMLKRLTALFFIFALAGQVLAGVCVCLDGKGAGKVKTSCCPLKKAKKNSVSKKTCCDSTCVKKGENFPRSQSESPVKIPLMVRKAVEKFVASLDERFVSTEFAPQPKGILQSSPRKPANPPDLYLQNHAFLI